MTDRHQGKTGILYLNLEKGIVFVCAFILFYEINYLMLTLTLSLVLLKVNIFKHSISCDPFSFRMSTYLFHPDTEIMGEGDPVGLDVCCSIHSDDLITCLSFVTLACLL